MTTAHVSGGAQRPAVRSGIYCRAAYSNFTRCDSVGSNFLGHTIIFSGPSRHFDSSQIRGRYFNADCATHAIKSPRCHLSNRIMLVHILRDSPQQCLQGYDVLPWPARSPDLSPIECLRCAWEGNCSRPEIQEN
ncbi:uncharacterized protein TNCV_786431 [Trichonephila clavipes]|nr:uncharacterized protein TNCV_786431 [Trichonephila clavipes]